MLTRTFAFLLLISSISIAQHDGWQNYTDSRNVHGVVSDGNYWWIATTGGLIKINMENGAKTVYNHANSPLPSNNLTCIDIDPNSDLTLWIGTKEGIAVYNRQESWTVYDMDNTPLPSNNITCLDYHESNEVLIGTDNGAVLRSGGNWVVYNDENSPIKYFHIDAVSVDNISQYYIGSGGRVFHYYSQVWTDLETPAGTRNITAMKKDGSIYLWVATYGEGIFSFDGYNWTNYDHYNSPFTSDNFTWLDIDDSNNLWTACYGQLWKRTAIGNWEYQYTDPNLSVSRVLVVSNDFLAVGCYNGFFTINQPGNSAVLVEYDITNSPFEYALDRYGENDKISSIFVDRESNEKYISANQQVYKISGFNAHIFTEHPFNPNFAIADIITDHLGRVWVGSDRANAVSMRGSDSWIQHNISGDNINCLLWQPTSEGSGILWVGGALAGLKSFDDPAWTSYPLDPYGIETTNISDLLLDDNGNIWITGSHLEKFNGANTVGYFNEINQLRTTCIAKEGNILWVGSFPYLNALGGIVKYDGTDFTTYFTENSDLPGNTVTKIVVDEFGKKYVGTTEGLAVFDDINDMAVYTRENSGLPDNNITAMDIDEEGNLWIGTGDGGVAILGNVIITEVGQNEIVSPTAYLLEQNYPNPFNPFTKIQFNLPSEQRIELEVFDILGRKVNTLLNNVLPAGSYSIDFDGRNIPSGIYFYRIVANDYIETKKMILLK